MRHSQSGTAGLACIALKLIAAGIFLFATSVIQAQPCAVTCQPGDLAENEPACGQPSDTVNGGCYVPPEFTTIQCGETFCGTGLWDSNTFALDNDFYAFTLTQPTQVTFTITAEYIPYMTFFGGKCPSLDQIDFAVGNACTPTDFSHCFPAGTFYLAISPLPDFSVDVPCGSRYRLSMSCAHCTLAPNSTCDAAIAVGVPSSTVGDTSTGFFNFDAPTCDTQVEAPGLWYTVVGTGHTLTAATCNPATQYQTRINVYCGNCKQLNCVAGNQTAPNCTAAQRSRVTWCSETGQTYFILVHGSGLQSGQFQLDVSDNGIACNNPTPCSFCPDPCPPGAQQEDEPSCGLTDIGQMDNTVNGGCNNNPPTFTTISCDVPVCGTVAFNGVFRDEDWYRLPLMSNSVVSWTVTPDFEADISIVAAAPACPSVYPIVNGTARRCETVTISTPCVSPNDYYLLVAPRFTDQVECGRKYTAVATCTRCAFCEIDCTNTIPENEPNCGLPDDTVNGGCVSSPFIAPPIQCGDRYCATAAFDGQNWDTDWYTFTATQPTRLTLRANAQFVIDLLILQLRDGCNENSALVWARAEEQPACQDVECSACIKPGIYYVFIRPSPFQIPFPHCRDYQFELECGPCPPCEVTCSPDAIDEDESDCGLPDDTVNGGCNSPTPVFTNIHCGDEVCATSAADPTVGRDTDWYQVQISTRQTVTWTVTPDFDAVIGFVDTQGVPNCALAQALNPAKVVTHCQSGSVSKCLNPGTWWLFVSPASFNAIPCGSQYAAKLTCGCGCPGDMDASGRLDGNDIAPFVQCQLGSPNACTTCSCADMDGDNQQTPADTSAFIAKLLSSSSCP